MATIEQVKIRATIEIGNLRVSTPFIQNFNVRKARGQISTMDATLKISHDDISGAITGKSITVKAGTTSIQRNIFSGMVRQAKISPCMDDPYYVILNVSAVDPLYKLEGKKFTRRCRATRSRYVTITGVVRKGLKSSKFRFRDENIEMNAGELTSEQKVTKKRPESEDIKTPPAPTGKEARNAKIEFTPVTEPISS